MDAGLFHLGAPRVPIDFPFGGNLKELLRQIQTDAADSRTEISDILRKCRILASRLGTTDFKDWVDFELNGYPNDAELPMYRIVAAPAVGWFSGGAAFAINAAPLPSLILDEKHRSYAERVFLRQPIGSYSDLVKQASKGKGGQFSVPWPANLVLIYHDKFYEDYVLMKAEQKISVGAIIALIECVRNKILAFTLDLETTTPEVIEDGKPLETTVREKASRIFHTHFHGNVSNVATGGTNFSQVAIMQVGKGDFESLRKALSELGIPEPDVNELRLPPKFIMAHEESFLSGTR